jgi:predicted phosphoribosyltransferase
MRRELFWDRREAGAFLAAQLGAYAGRDDVVVLGLPRGGVPVAYEVARLLRATLDVFVVRKLGLPGHRELAMGAIASGGVRVLNDDVVEHYDVTAHTLDEVAREQQIELDRREQVYRGGQPLTPLGGRIAILVDDGLATGATMKAAAKAVRALGPSRLVIAVPVGPASSCREMEAFADEVICAWIPSEFYAVGQFYRAFDQTTDQEIHDLMRDFAALSTEAK